MERFKITTKIMVFALAGSLFLAPSAMAATNVVFTPSASSVIEGQSFSLTISVNPQNIKNYTTKIQLNYPANLVEVTSFSFSSGWLAISQPGYDSIDNTNGVLVKSAGYPGGFDQTKTFGIVTFKAKKSGSAQIALGSGSASYDAQSQNQITNFASSATVGITSSAPAPSSEPEQPAAGGSNDQPTVGGTVLPPSSNNPAPVQQQTQTVAQTQDQNEETVQTENNETQEEQADAQTEDQNEEGLVAGEETKGITDAVSNNWPWILLGLAILAGAVTYLYKGRNTPTPPTSGGGDVQE